MARFYDVLERSAWTFVQAFAGADILVPGLSIGAKLKIGIGAGALAVLKSLSISQTVEGQLKVLGGLKTGRKK